MSALRHRLQHPLFNCEVSQDIIADENVDVPVPIGRSAECAPGELDRLDGVTVAALVVLAHAVAVHDVEDAAFTGDEQQVRAWTRLVRKEHGPSGAEIVIVRVQFPLVERSEVVADLKTAPGEA